MRKKLFLISCFLTLFIIAGCKEEKIVTVAPFIGGPGGVEINFGDMRKEVFDGGDDLFDVVLKLENKGEEQIKKEDINVKLTGIRPQEFGKLESEMIKNSPEDLIPNRKDAEGNLIPGPPAFVEFKKLNHVTPITGTRLEYTLRTEACYLYKTRAVSKLCFRENLLVPTPGGLCEIEEQKPLFNSGAPVHVQNFRESARGKDKVGFNFEVVQVGSGSIHELGSACDNPKKKNKVHMRVDTHMEGLSCTGLGTKSGTALEGDITLFDGKKIISCTQTIKSPANFEQFIEMEITYKHFDFSTMQLTVKSSGA